MSVPDPLPRVRKPGDRFEPPRSIDRLRPRPESAMEIPDRWAGISRRPALIRLERVSVRRGATAVLHEVSVEIPGGAITAVVGPSGVGKTTLLATLNGLVRPVAGSVTVAGIGSLDTAGNLRGLRRRTGTVFQEHALIDRLSALDNVLLGLADRRHPLSLLPWPRDLRYRAAEALDEVGLLHRANLRTDRLSGGERQRVGIARALVRRPDLLLGDEPFSAVDPALVRQMGAMLRQRVADQGLTVVLVMHQIGAALALADKVVALEGGRVAFDGPARSFDDASLARVFRFPARGPRTGPADAPGASGR